MLKGITVCVEYTDYLSITWPWNNRHFDDFLVITSIQDRETQEYCKAHGIKIHTTDVFYQNGAFFNKGAALESGFDVLGRDSWTLILDADILLPVSWTWPLKRHTLFGMKRRECLDDQWRVKDWKSYPRMRDIEIAGYFQLFHGPSVSCPWYETDWTHAGGADSMFSRRFARKQWLEWNVLHLGTRDTNWFGRVDRDSNRGVLMNRFLDMKGWNRPQVPGIHIPEKLGELQ